MDTGGIIENPVDPVSKQMQFQVEEALRQAHVILFVVDGQEPITRVDQEVKEQLFKYGKPVVLAVNKLDNIELLDNRFDFFELGRGEPFAISSGHNTGMEPLMDALVAHIPEGELWVEEEKKITKVAVVGKPNVGKSSFINAILNEERTIVDDVPGTTRDAIDIEFKWEEKEYLFIDTAGMRKKAGIKQKVEQFSVTRSLRAVRRADICMLLIDATEGLSEQDKRIVGYCEEQGTAMILVWTKWDLIEDKGKKYESIADEIDLKMPKIKYVPYLTISNITRQRLFNVFEYIDRVAAQAELRVGTGPLNKLVEDIKRQHNPPSIRGKHAKILYATQAGIKPTTFILFVNQKRLFHFSYMRYITNKIRETYGFEGVPIKVELREGKPRDER